MPESIVSTVIPHLLVKHVAAPERARPAKDPAEARAEDLARLLIAPNLADAFDLIDQALTRAASPTALFTGLFEPTARKLGDLWSDDACSEFEVTIGLCHLQTAMRRISFDLLSAPLTRSQPRTVLIVSQPGEPHSFCAALHSELLRQAGWNTVSEFPDTDAALADLVANGWFDAVNLSLSPALRRGHWLPRVAETIRKIRRASRNPALAIVTSGRIFSERADACAVVGADAATVSSVQIERCLMRSLLNRTARPAANFAWI
ncbi:photosynthesis regulator [Rhodopseudomonas sp. HC1]|uniref:cobalamin B12-binding domain-containing protein n=1 Tax=Rhodopseudomonas infernalis TaxID=2897386 RepID=UPI001EE7F435|nr:photosynthesis regulator [Rhodopseudomonas infernalis]MCG6207525.1 photosynthesis regulator [Rhodopseudomonas infernalis]